jgi:hypothetical protein
MPTAKQLLISTSVASVIALLVFGFLYLIGYAEDAAFFATIAGAMTCCTVTISQVEDDAAEAEASSSGSQG